jgi:hypothetical protein
MTHPLQAHLKTMTNAKESTTDKIINKRPVNLHVFLVMVPPDIWPKNRSSRRGLAVRHGFFHDRLVSLLLNSTHRSGLLRKPIEVGKQLDSTPARHRQPDNLFFIFESTVSVAGSMSS